MKSKKLIEILQSLDPEGEIEVVIGCEDILSIERLPGYYDGVGEVLIRDENNPYYNVVGAKLVRKSDKIRIHSYSIEDALEVNSDLPIDYSEVSDCTLDYKEKYERLRDEIKKGRCE